MCMCACVYVCVCVYACVPVCVCVYLCGPVRAARGPSHRTCNDGTFLAQGVCTCTDLNSSRAEFENVYSPISLFVFF